eukprot:TRINITY_DN10734_c0_g1_i3.p1 TRINITY_DN10734_c0_g1~~TRINITY_DN10734_c0_g1_i3.p1  ORF type:complete len:378 (-),score=108.75 TRINITY_DN10734_c0_g1_i3:64-1197(-)
MKAILGSEVAVRGLKYLFRFPVGLCGLWAALLYFACTVLLRANVVKERILADPQYPSLPYLKYSLCSFVGFTLAKMLMLTTLSPLVESFVRVSAEGDVATQIKERTRKLVVSLWTFCVHSSFFAWSLVLLLPQPWFVPLLFSLPTAHTQRVEAVAAMWTNYPYLSHVPMLHVFLMIQLGYYLHSLFATLVEARRSNFYEMMLHHAAGAILIFLCFFQNTTRVGALVLVVHDSSDIPLSLLRCVVTTKYSKLMTVTYIATVISWMYLRLYVFPTRIIWDSLMRPLLYKSVQWTEAYAWLGQICLLSLLLVMHCYWFSQLMKAAKVYVSTGDPVDVNEDDKTFSFKQPKGVQPTKLASAGAQQQAPTAPPAEEETKKEA